MSPVHTVSPSHTEYHLVTTPCPLFTQELLDTPSVTWSHIVSFGHPVSPGHNKYFLVTLTHYVLPSVT